MTWLKVVGRIALFLLLLSNPLAPASAAVRHESRSPRILQVAHPPKAPLPFRLVASRGEVTLADGEMAFRRAIIEMTNRYRAEYGLGPLREEKRLEVAAIDRVRDMERQHYFEHVSPQGVEPESWIDRRGYEHEFVGENLAAGYETAEQVVTTWLHSPAHRENLLSSNYRDIGIATSDESPVADIDGPLVVALYGAEAR